MFSLILSHFCPTKKEKVIPVVKEICQLKIAPRYAGQEISYSTIVLIINSSFAEGFYFRYIIAQGIRSLLGSLFCAKGMFGIVDELLKE